MNGFYPQLAFSAGTNQSCGAEIWIWKNICCSLGCYCQFLYILNLVILVISFSVADGCTLKEHLIDELDYNLLPEEAWFKLTSWYGVISDQRALQRKVVEHGMYVKNCKVEVYLIGVKLSQHSDPNTLVPRQFSRGDTIGEFLF